MLCGEACLGNVGGCGPGQAQGKQDKGGEASSQGASKGDVKDISVVPDQALELGDCPKCPYLAVGYEKAGPQLNLHHVWLVSYRQSQCSCLACCAADFQAQPGSASCQCCVLETDIL